MSSPSPTAKPPVSHRNTLQQKVYAYKFPTYQHVFMCMRGNFPRTTESIMKVLSGGVARGFGQAPGGARDDDSTFSRTVSRLYGGAKGLVV
jgi:hypothetical protein